MKKLLLLPLLFGVFMVSAAAAKGPDAHTGAVQYGWHLSGAVMPVPPYGAGDIPGSDTASKLIVNQPNGKPAALITGIMSGLAPNTTYTVYLSKPYTPYTATGWGLNGVYTIDFSYLGSDYIHAATISGQSGNTFAIAGGYPAAGPFVYAWNGTGTTTGNSIAVGADYTLGAVGTHMTMTGIVASDGSMTGTWSDNYGGPRTGSWSTATGHAVLQYTGSTGWPGLLTQTVQPFTFTTDASGSGSWHLNLTNADITLPTDFSVWVNGSGGTVLISDSVHLF